MKILPTEEGKGNMATRLIVDVGLGRDRLRADAKLEEFKSKYPEPQYRVQFSVHAPEGYEDAYSVQVFQNG